MDNHPIPQDVTGFQFRLVGDMTIKQFAYLAAGVILAWISFSLPIFVLLKLPLVAFFAGGGVVFAFIPLGGRPADAMVLYFFKAVFSPTQYTYSSQDQQITQETAKMDNSLPQQKKEGKKEETVHLASSVGVVFPQPADKAEEPHPALSPMPEPEKIQLQTPNTLPPSEETAQELTKETTELAKALQEAKKEEVAAQKGSEEAQEAHQKATDLEAELQTIQEQKRQLEEKLIELQKQLATKSEPVFSPSTAKQTVTENVRKVPPSMQKTVGTPFVTDVPNLICGIVKDPRGNVLPNMLIEVKDKDGNPVRAFKTNPLGQFASATPVINGTYTITFEDPNGKQRFDSVELSATGDILAPLEVISIDAREDLRKELFGG